MNETTRILFLGEDNDDDAFLTIRALQDAGVTHRIERCRDGQEIVTRLQDSLAGNPSPNAVPDLILLDLKMPRLGGLDTLAWIRNQEAFRSLVVLALTSSKEPRDVEMAYRLHINAYLVKPSSLREMVALAGAIRAFWLDEKHFIHPPIGLS